MTESPRDVALFVTCLADLVRPTVAFATIAVLEKAGCRVHVPEAQTCCGQPAYNSGDAADTKPIARQVIETFEGYDHVVVPSGSCGGMISHHYPVLFAGDGAWEDRAKALAAKTHELVDFLVNVLGIDDLGAAYDGVVTYHDSCSSLREIGVRDEARRLLDKVTGMTLREGQETESCCGFGGLFCVKYPEISTRMVDVKVDDVLATGADTLLAGDLGCLLNIAGRLQRRGSGVKVRHIAEVLAGATDVPPIGDVAHPVAGASED